MTNSHLSIEQFTHNPRTDEIETVEYQSELSYPIRYRPEPQSHLDNPFETPNPNLKDEVRYQDAHTVNTPDSHRSQSSSEVSFVTTLECQTHIPDQRISTHLPTIHTGCHDYSSKVNARIYSTARYLPQQRTFERYTVTSSIPSYGGHPQGLASVDIDQRVHQVNNQLTHLLGSDTRWFSAMLKSPPDTLDTYQDVEKALFDRISLVHPDPKYQVELVQLDPHMWQEMTGLVLLDHDQVSPGDLSSSDEDIASIRGCAAPERAERDDQITVTEMSGLLDSSPSTVSSIRTRDGSSKRRVRRLGRKLKYVWDNKLSCCTKPEMDCEEGNYGMVPRHSDLFD